MMQFRERALPNSYLRAEFELTKLGDQAPYFSVTGSEWASKSHARRWPDNPLACGQLHTEILAAWPDMADLVALHLSDIDGTPMHALANSRYFFEQGNLAGAAKLLRVSVEDLPATAAEFPEFVQEQRERWAAEAFAAIVKYGLTVTQV